jgi:hypothetical protein
MVETIGNPGICIHQIDRKEILIALDNLLDMRKKELKKTEDDFIKRGIIRPKDIIKNPLIITFEDMIEHTKNTRNRVINTPEC